MALPKINAPRYDLVLPSTGQKVSYRPYLVKEEKIIMMAAESADEGQMVRAVKDVIASCTDNGVDTNNITMFDLEYVFIQLRAKSVGESTTIKARCGECSEMNDVEVDLSNTRVDMPKDAQKGVTKQLTDDISVVLKYPNVDTVVSATEKATDVDAAFNLIASCMDAIYQGDSVYDVSTASREEIVEFIESLNTQQFGQLQEFVESMPSAKMDIQFKCTHCSHDNTTEIRGLANFFS